MLPLGTQRNILKERRAKGEWDGCKWRAIASQHQDFMESQSFTNRVSQERYVLAIAVADGHFNCTGLRTLTATNDGSHRSLVDGIPVVGADVEHVNCGIAQFMFAGFDDWSGNAAKDVHLVVEHRSCVVASGVWNVLRVTHLDPFPMVAPLCEDEECMKRMG